MQEDGRAWLTRKTRGCMVCVPEGTARHTLGLPLQMECCLVHSEVALFEALEELIRDCDPDLLIGFEVQQSSYGYVLERARQIGFAFDRSLSRCPVFRSVLEQRRDQYGEMAQSGIHICGREILNVWRICRGEIKLLMYSYAHVCEKVLNKRVPVYSYGSLHHWFEGVAPGYSSASKGVPSSSASNPLPSSSTSAPLPSPVHLEPPSAQPQSSHLASHGTSLGTSAVDGVAVEAESKQDQVEAYSKLDQVDCCNALQVDLSNAPLAHAVIEIETCCISALDVGAEVAHVGVEVGDGAGGSCNPCPKPLSYATCRESKSEQTCYVAGTHQEARAPLQQEARAWCEGVLSKGVHPPGAAPQTSDGASSEPRPTSSSAAVPSAPMAGAVESDVLLQQRLLLQCLPQQGPQRVPGGEEVYKEVGDRDGDIVGDTVADTVGDRVGNYIDKLARPCLDATDGASCHATGAGAPAGKSSEQQEAKGSGHAQVDTCKQAQVDMGTRRHMRRVLLYHTDRAENCLAILEAMELVGRTCELARVFGIDMFSVLSRGSQYRVESMMYRLARSQNYCLVSPAVQQRQAQPATECIPLVMEPVSAYYDCPICVLDFRSLYPSVVIAYNLCYTTCLGKVGSQPDSEGVLKLGASSLLRPPGMLAALQNDTYVSPNGVVYVQAHVREGVLPRLLREILSARVAVKKLMKEALRAKDMQLYRALNARQFGLKLIANVTYGYTSAGFSGRMPCAELADSIVQTGRESLEQAVKTVDSKKKEWGARVVYGDTDSLFVQLPGRSKEQAFRIGKEIAAYVTAQSPAPMELELEKVYLPSLMITKKRYVGYSYESASCTSPVLDPKGIEMVRRDGCKLLSRVQEKCLRELFETNDLSRVKRYLQSVMASISTSALNVSEYVFAKEVRAGTYHSVTLPAAAVVDDAKRRRDPRAGALHSERVPYVVVCGPPGSRLVDICVDPIDLVNSHGNLRINSNYYIQKQLLPALERLFSLLGADVRRWYLDMPRSSRDRSALSSPSLLPLFSFFLQELHLPCLFLELVG